MSGWPTTYKTLRRGRHAQINTETTDLDGYVVEVAVVDAATGSTLLDTLVNPGCPIEPGAQAVHGISDADVAGAPPWAGVLPRLLEVTRGRTVLAYNAAFDSGVIAQHTCRDELDPGHLQDDGRWACLMGRRSAWALRYRWLPLGGGHRALARVGPHILEPPGHVELERMDVPLVLVVRSFPVRQDSHHVPAVPPAEVAANVVPDR